MNQVSLVVPLNQVSLDGSPETQNHHRRAWATQQCLPSSPIIPASTGPQLRAWAWKQEACGHALWPATLTPQAEEWLRSLIEKFGK